MRPSATARLERRMPHGEYGVSSASRPAARIASSAVGRSVLSVFTRRSSGAAVCSGPNGLLAAIDAKTDLDDGIRESAKQLLLGSTPEQEQQLLSLQSDQPNSCSVDDPESVADAIVFLTRSRG